MCLSDPNERPSVFACEVSRVGNGQSPQRQTCLDDEVHKIERVTGHALIRGIIEHQPSALIRRDDLSRQEMLRGPGGFAAPGWAAEDDEYIARHDYLVQSGRRSLRYYERIDEL